MLETFPNFGAGEISKFLKPGMGPLLLLSVILHCFFQTAAAQQEQLEGQKQVAQGQEPVRKSGYYLASVNRSQKSGDSEQTWKKQKLKTQKYLYWASTSL